MRWVVSRLFYRVLTVSMSFVSWIYIIIVQWPYIRIKRDEDVGISSFRSADQTSTSVEEDSCYMLLRREDHWQHGVLTYAAKIFKDTRKEAKTKHETTAFYFDSAI